MLSRAHIIIKIYMLLTSKPQRIPKGKSGETAAKGTQDEQKQKTKTHHNS